MSRDCTKLYSYCLRRDAGAAPNPFWGLCTLVICKPKIRRTAAVNDWVVGLGSTNSPIGDVSDCVIYAMKVTKKISMREYDELCRTSLPRKIPQWRNQDDYRVRVGDCLYDYSDGEPPRVRRGIHDEKNRERDLGGEYALLSTHFFYFGDKPVQLPKDLVPIIHCAPGHKSSANEPYWERFVAWIEGYEANRLYGEPQDKLKVVCDPRAGCECVG